MPEASQNPLGYKFSWSPKGVLLAATRDAKYMQDGKVIDDICCSHFSLWKFLEPLCLKQSKR
jgi:saccharopine dehydrogenase-like NADP-dependent oxidoreductase